MTRREELQKLPLQKRLQAMENIRRQNSSFSFSERINAENCNVPLLFVYIDTRQGHDYWRKIDKKYFS